MLMSRHALERKKYHCGGHSWRGGFFTKQLKKWVKDVFLLGCYGCIFHGTGNSAHLCQNFGIPGGLNTPTPPRYANGCLVFSLKVIQLLQMSWVQIISECPSYIVFWRAHESNLPFSTAGQQQKFCVCLHSWLNGICKQTKFPVRFWTWQTGAQHRWARHISYSLP